MYLRRFVDGPRTGGGAHFYVIKMIERENARARGEEEEAERTGKGRRTLCSRELCVRQPLASARDERIKHKEIRPPSSGISTLLLRTVARPVSDAADTFVNAIKFNYGRSNARHAADTIIYTTAPNRDSSADNS